MSIPPRKRKFLGGDDDDFPNKKQRTDPNAMEIQSSTSEDTTESSYRPEDITRGDVTLSNKQTVKTSLYHGVHWYAPDSTWIAQITVNKTAFHLGNFKTDSNTKLLYLAFPLVS
jgi:hypothetical protein